MRASKETASAALEIFNQLPVETDAIEDIIKHGWTVDCEQLAKQVAFVR